MTAWQPTRTAPENEVIETKIDDEHGDRNHASLKRHGSLWFLPDGSMYVYYTPTHWRHIAAILLLLLLAHTCPPPSQCSGPPEKRPAGCAACYDDV